MDRPIYATSIVMPHSARRKVPVPALARWLLGLGIAATLAASVAHGLGDGLAGAPAAAWPTVALVGSYELLMMIIRSAAESPEQSAQPPARRTTCGMSVCFLVWQRCINMQADGPLTVAYLISSAASEKSAAAGPDSPIVGNTRYAAPPGLHDARR